MPKPLTKMERLYAAFSEPIPQRAVRKREVISAEAVELEKMVRTQLEPRLQKIAAEQAEIRARIEELKDKRPAAQIYPFNKG